METTRLNIWHITVNMFFVHLLCLSGMKHDNFQVGKNRPWAIESRKTGLLIEKYGTKWNKNRQSFQVLRLWSSKNGGQKSPSDGLGETTGWHPPRLRWTWHPPAFFGEHGAWDVATEESTCHKLGIDFQLKIDELDIEWIWLLDGWIAERVHCLGGLMHSFKKNTTTSEANNY
jgi:hypothetical protein